MRADPAGTMSRVLVFGTFGVLNLKISSRSNTKTDALTMLAQAAPRRRAERVSAMRSSVWAAEARDPAKGWQAFTSETLARNLRTACVRACARLVRTTERSAGDGERVAASTESRLSTLAGDDVPHMPLAPAMIWT
eukprot:6005305-Prymnesium_polylepis.2